jgi:NAD(P)-dependent dehydrogenase (short-subunit alcohol dehydrogenase family)
MRGDPFRDRVAVITGGAAGIGLAMARAFAGRGAHLVLADIDERALADAKKELAAAGGRVLGVRTDVRERASVAALADATLREFGRAHIVCNNAGIAVSGPLAEATPEQWATTLAIDFWGVVHGVDAFLPQLLAQEEGGHILNTASMAGLVGMQGLGVYCAAKFAVVGLTESLHRELRGTRVGVSVLCPMIVATEIGANSQRMLGAAAPPPAPTEAGAVPPPGMSGAVITPEAVARRVVAGIERGEFYIFTHPEQREILRRRAARQDAAFGDELTGEKGGIGR